MCMYLSVCYWTQHFILYRTLYISVEPMHENNQLYLLVMFMTDNTCASDNSWL